MRVKPELKAQYAAAAAAARRSLSDWVRLVLDDASAAFKPIQGAAAPKRQPGTLKGLIKIDPAFFDPMSEEESPRR
jgi:hypothetical protein